MKSVSPRHLLRRLFGASSQSLSEREPAAPQELSFSDAKAYVEEVAQPTTSPDDTKFIISCAARTGSTMLVHLLRANTNILCHGEVYGGETLGSLWGKYRQLREEDANFDRALHRMAEGGPEDFLKGGRGSGLEFHSLRLPVFFCGLGSVCRATQHNNALIAQ